MPVLCPHRSPRPHAAPRHARPPSADASSRLQRAPSPPALRLPESPAAPPSCPASPRGPATRPLEGALALSVTLTNPPCSPQALLPPWACRRGRGVHPRPSSPVTLPVSLVFFLSGHFGDSSPSSFPSSLPERFSQGPFHQVFFFLCKAASARLEIKRFKNGGLFLCGRGTPPLCHRDADRLLAVTELRWHVRAWHRCHIVPVKCWIRGVQPGLWPVLGGRWDPLIRYVRGEEDAP